MWTRGESDSRLSNANAAQCFKRVHISVDPGRIGLPPQLHNVLYTTPLCRSQCLLVLLPFLGFMAMDSGI